jgi:uncharacterized YigZ family protein
LPLNSTSNQLPNLQTVTATFTSDYRVKGSRFLGYLHPASAQAEAEKFIDEIKGEHPTATHHCYAWRVNPSEPEEFEQDDGEPRGTAGLPILNAMRSAHLMNAVLVSVRYYGGTKLGKAGLIEAYGTSASLCIEAARLQNIIAVTLWRLKYEYPQQSLIDKLRNDFPLIEIDSEYLENVSLKIACPSDVNERFSASIRATEHKLIELEQIGTSYHIEK